MKPGKHKYLHVSTDWHGAVWTAKLQAPKWVGSSEPLTPRLCVGLHLAGCLAARWLDGQRDVYVYETEPRRSINPGRLVWDSLITQERWIVPPVKLKHVFTIKAPFLNKGQRPRPSETGVSIHDRIDDLVLMTTVVELHAPQFRSKFLERFSAALQKAQADGYLRRTAPRNHALAGHPGYDR